MQAERVLIENKNNFFAPYTKNKILSDYWSVIISRYLLLYNLNKENKNLLDKKILINKNFLELVKIYSNKYTYDINGNINY